MVPTPNVMPRKTPAGSTIRRNTRKPNTAKRRNEAGEKLNATVEAKLHYPEWYRGRHARAYSKAVEDKLKEIKRAHRKRSPTPPPIIAAVDSTLLCSGIRTRRTAP